MWALKPNPVIHLTVNSVMDYDDPFLVNPDVVGRLDLMLLFVLWQYKYECLL